MASEGTAAGSEGGAMAVDDGLPFPTASSVDPAVAAKTRIDKIVSTAAASSSIPENVLRGLFNGIANAHQAHVARGELNRTDCFGCGFHEETGDIAAERRAFQTELDKRSEDAASALVQYNSAKDQLAGVQAQLTQLGNDYEQLGGLHTALDRQYHEALAQVDINRRAITGTLRHVADLLHAGERMPRIADLTASFPSIVDIHKPGPEVWDHRLWEPYWVQCFRRGILPPTLEWSAEYDENGEFKFEIEGQSARATVMMDHVADFDTDPHLFVAGLVLMVQPAKYRAYVDRPGAGNYVREPAPGETYSFNRPLGFSSTDLDPLMYAMTRGCIEESFVQSLLYGCRLGWLNCIVNGKPSLRPPGWEAIWDNICSITPSTPGDNRLRDFGATWLPPAVHRKSIADANAAAAANLQAAHAFPMRGRGRGRGRGGFHPYSGRGRGGHQGQGLF